MRNTHKTCTRLHSSNAAIVDSNLT